MKGYKACCVAGLLGFVILGCSRTNWGNDIQEMIRTTKGPLADLIRQAERLKVKVEADVAMKATDTTQDATHLKQTFDQITTTPPTNAGEIDLALALYIRGGKDVERRMKTKEERPKGNVDIDMEGMYFYSLGKSMAIMKDPALLPAVLDKATHAQGPEKPLVILMLGNIGDKKAVPVLLKALDESYCPEASLALMRIHDADTIPQVIAKIHSCEKQRPTSSETIGVSLYAQGFPALEKAAASLKTGTLPEETRETLLRHVIAPTRDPRAIPILKDLAGNPDPKIRERAIYALAEIKDPGCLTIYLGALHDTDREVQIQAIRGLGTVNTSDSIAALMDVLNNNSSLTVRAEAAAALGTLKATTALTALKTSEYHDLSPNVRVAAAKAVKAITGEDYDYNQLWRMQVK